MLCVVDVVDVVDVAMSAEERSGNRLEERSMACMCKMTVASLVGVSVSHQLSFCRICTSVSSEHPGISA